jgi:isopenicillin N synthase-like dioxygenase
MENCYLTCETISGQILSAMELGLGLPAGAFTNMCTHEANASEFRLMHYPPIDLAEMRKGQNRISPHFDLGVITLLFQDNVGGLEMEDRTRPGEFVPVSPGAPADMVVNISETLQRWTNDVIRAGMHRVTLPPQLKEAEAGTIPERYSITYFCKADRNVSLAPLPQFVSKERAPAYDDVTALEYHQRRLLAAY